jgi:hypothetical protein
MSSIEAEIPALRGEKLGRPLQVSFFAQRVLP